MKKVLDKKFFLKPATKVAPELLGKILARKIGSKIKYLLITETEAYQGREDKASHASRGMTERNKIMFEEGGRWYVYFTYGIHWLINIVTEAKDFPSAVLLRGGILIDDGQRVNGPAVLTKKFRIDKKLNNKPADKKSGLWIEDWGIKIDKKEIKTSARTGVDYAGKRWAKRKWKFFI